MLNLGDQSKQKVALHLGFHKTATTKIQNLLELNAEKIAASGSYVLPHQRVRNNYTRYAEYLTNNRIGMSFAPNLDEQELERKYQRIFTTGRIKKFDRIIISEENAFGHVGQCVFPGMLYRFPKQNIHTFGELMPLDVEAVHVTVRSFTRFFASCYTEYLGSVSPARYISAQTMAAKVMANPPSWVNHIQMLKDVFPQSPIHVWVYEKFDHLLPEFLKKLSGREFSNIEIDSSVRIRPSLGAEAVQKFDATIEKSGIRTAQIEWRESRQSLMEKNRSDHESFDPWSNRQRTHLDAIYQRDLEKIGAFEWVHLHG